MLALKLCTEIATDIGQGFEALVIYTNFQTVVKEEGKCPLQLILLNK